MKLSKEMEDTGTWASWIEGVKQLKARVELLQKKYYSALCTKCGYMRPATEIEKENEALREYATHKPGCHESGNECICELYALLKREQDA